MRSELGEHFFQCWLEDGATISKSEELGTDSLPRLAASDEDVTFEWITLPNGERARAVGLRVDPIFRAAGPFGDRELLPRLHDEGDSLEIAVARTVEDLDTTLSRLKWLLILTWLSLTVGCAAIGYWVVSRSLRPVESLREQIGAMGEETLRDRLVVDDAPAELRPVVGQINALLDRLQHAFEREHAFTSDAAHELRTPIAGLRSMLEVALIRQRSGEEYRKTVHGCLAITNEMQDVVETLLDLARLGSDTFSEESAASSDELEHVSLCALAEECFAPYASMAGGRGVQLEVDADRGLEVATELRLLRRVLHNLFENAVTYAAEGGTVTVRGRSLDHAVDVTISNPVTGASPELATNAFQAFWRADSSRTNTGRHAGLGLALCRRIVEILGGHVHATLDDDVFTVHLSLPPSRRAA
ncbi:MAG: GHKL domain-containing protein [bacterium]|nr:GHKL domain-containing protein [bacterium]